MITFTFYKSENTKLKGLHRYWWRMLETKCVDDKFEMLVNLQHNEKAANLMILPPTSKISHHHKVTNIMMSPTSRSPSFQLLNIYSLNPMAWFKYLPSDLTQTWFLLILTFRYFVCRIFPLCWCFHCLWSICSGLYNIISVQ